MKKTCGFYCLGLVKMQNIGYKKQKPFCIGLFWVNPLKQCAGWITQNGLSFCLLGCFVSEEGGFLACSPPSTFVPWFSYNAKFYSIKCKKLFFCKNL